MTLETSLVEQLQIVINGSDVFNNEFNNRIRELDVPYYLKISLVKSGGNVSCYPCDSSCKVMPRKLITKTKTSEKGSYVLEASDEKEDERCFRLCDIFPIDIKYLNLAQIETYLDNRSETLVKKDFEGHKENKPLFGVLTPELFIKLEQKTEIPSSGIEKEVQV